MQPVTPAAAHGEVIGQLTLPVYQEEVDAHEAGDVQEHERTEVDTIQPRPGDRHAPPGQQQKGGQNNDDTLESCQREAGQPA